MDDVDKKILAFLREDSRKTYTEIAKTLNVSTGTVRKKVQNLVATGTIKRFTIDISDGLNKAVVLVSTSPAVPTSKIAENILLLDGVETAFEVAGQFDISVLISGEDIATINHCIEGVRSIEGVQNTNTLIVLKKWSK
ncbi:MAG: Lrp/AsnC family transcriptional regulator [Candidatus Bathyarchaeota archaeon]|nr:MAG: Lrp/AsnC family transcriptional regulator [Candidatus Bathyarchaeota archaeon]